MELNEKLQMLRKQKGMTQEELAGRLYVSRTAVSKWESGRGMPNLDSLKALSGFFSVSLDDLLSGDELFAIAEKDHREKEGRTLDWMIGFMDGGMLLMLFLPFFGEKMEDSVRAVSLFQLTLALPCIKGLCLAGVITAALLGIMRIILAKKEWNWWGRNRNILSVGFGTVLVLLFILIRQPYAAAFAFIFLLIKGIMLFKMC